MLFEVLRNGKVVMHTNDEGCIPPLELLHKMLESNHTLRKDGKPYKPPAVRGVRGEKKKEEKINGMVKSAYCNP